MSERKYAGKFGVTECYPKEAYKRDRSSGEIVEAKTISFTLPHSEALRLAAAIVGSANAGSQGNIEIKIDRRESKRAVGTRLLTGTVTWL